VKKTILFFLLSSLIIACDKNLVFEEFESIPDNTWNMNTLVHFNVNINDTSELYNVFINIRTTDNYQYSNLYLFVSTNAPNGYVQRDTIELTLADEYGKWLGKGTAGIKTLNFPYLQNIRFPYIGIYTFEIEQAMRVTDLKSVKNIGLRVETSGETDEL